MALTPNPPGSQYWLTTFSNPKTGANRRIALYAATAEAADSRLRSYLASNPFGLGATDQNDFMKTWDSTTHGLTPSSAPPGRQDRKSTRLNSSHSQISYAVFCFKKKN